MQLEFLFRDPDSGPAHPDRKIGPKTVPIELVRNNRARNYILRVREDGSIRVTVPRYGNRRDALKFVEEKSGWIEKQLDRKPRTGLVPLLWPLGTRILLFGDQVCLEAEDGSANPVVVLGDFSFPVPTLEGDLRPHLEPCLREIASRMLVKRTRELAQEHRLTVNQVIIRAQRTRWGSCSSKANISLNWRLVFTPAFVTDYIIVHELMHLKEMNHSKRYWRHVEKAIPRYREAEDWLRHHSRLLH